MPILHWLNREQSIKTTAQVPYRFRNDGTDGEQVGLGGLESKPPAVGAAK